MSDQAAICNKDCFNCPYPDCVVDGIISDSEIEQSQKIDAAIRGKSRNKNLECRRKYVKNHRKECSQSTQRWRHRNPEHCREYAKQYYQTHHQQIIANSRKYREKKRKERENATREQEGNTTFA